MKRTPWFKADQKPARIGVYQKLVKGWDDDDWWFSRWDGKHWLLTCYTADEAAAQTGRSAYQNEPWRGLAKKP